MWDELEGVEDHPAPAAPATQERLKLGDYLNMSDEEFEKQTDPSAFQSSQDVYHDYNDDQLLQEEKSQNPVYPDSVGPDHETTPAVWVDEDLLKDVEDLKEKLFNVENRLAKQMGGGEKWVEKAHEPDNKFMSEIESLRDRIGKISNNLGVKDEPSPWQIKKD
jgi:hypothetical protein